MTRMQNSLRGPWASISCLRFGTRCRSNVLDTGLKKLWCLSVDKSHLCLNNVGLTLLNNIAITFIKDQNCVDVSMGLRFFTMEEIHSWPIHM